MKKYDNCVICKKRTKEHNIKDIKSRKYYIEGAGQLCEACHTKIYNTRLKKL